MMGPALRMLVSLGIVLALMYIAAMLLRRTHGGSVIRAASGGTSAAKPMRPKRRGRGISMTAMSSLASSFVGGPGSSGDSIGTESPTAAVAGLSGRRALRRSKARKRNRLEVLARQSLGKNASVAVVRVGGRTLIVGVTDMAVQLLSEVDASVFDDPDESLATPFAPATADAVVHAGPASAHAASSGLSVLDLLRERTVRRA
jgi:flagellar biogenesis protein FliO